MKTLVFADGTSLEFVDTSTVTYLQTVVNTYSEVDAIRNKFTEANLASVTFDGESYQDLIPVSCDANAEASESITISIVNAFKQDEEIKMLRKQVQDLEAQNAVLADKAEAADILLGNEEVES